MRTLCEFPSRTRTLRMFAQVGLFAGGLAVTATRLPAQTFNVIHTFTGEAAGANPQAGVTFDRAGNLYGITAGGVFKLARSEAGWLFAPLYSFKGGTDGSIPAGEVVLGADGSVYGVTANGGGNGCIDHSGCGTVYNLKPPPSPCKAIDCPWVETILYRFRGDPDGWLPYAAPIFGHAGNLYGTTEWGGADGGWGAVYELSRSGGDWSESLLFSFNSEDGSNPGSQLALDHAGDLYGTASDAASGGRVFQLTPTGSAWLENELYAFQGGSDGAQPLGGVIVDGAGNLYGATTSGGSGGGGTVYELSPSNGGWNFQVLAALTGLEGPTATLARDAAGNLYGVAVQDGVFEKGVVFKLVPSNGGWTYISLHDFTGGSDGKYPVGRATFDANGNLYGTAEQGGGMCDCGVVWEITP